MKYIKVGLTFACILLFIIPIIGQSTQVETQTIELTIKGGFALRIGIINTGGASVTGHYTLVDRTKTREGSIVAAAHQYSEQMHSTKRFGITTVTITCGGQELTKPVLTLMFFVYVL